MAVAVKYWTRWLLNGHSTWISFAGLVLAAAACAIMVAGCTGSAFSVDGREAHSGRYSSEVARRLALAKEKNPRELEGKRGQRLKEKTEMQVATEMIKDALMEEQARKLGIKVQPSEAERRLEEERREKGYDRFNRELASQGLTQDEYLKNLDRQILLEELGKKISSEASAGMDEAESYYLTNKETFSRRTAAHIAHILLDTEGEARIVADELKSGRDFETLAKSLSIDRATASTGGDMGWIEQGTLEPALEQVAFSLAPGLSSGVVEASDGYHILKVLDRREANTPPFDEIKNKVLDALLNKRKEEKFSDWLRTVYANAVVQVNLAIGKWDPRLGMVVSSSETD